MKFPHSTTHAPPPATALADGGFDRALGEAVPAELRSCFRGATEPHGECPSPHRLGLERGDGRVDRFCLDAPLLEVEADRLVPPPPPREGLSASGGQACVVEIADPLEGVECLVPLGLADPCFRQALVELVPGTIVAAKSTRGELDGVPVRQVRRRPLARAPRSPRRPPPAAGGGRRSPAPAARASESPAGSPARHRGAP